MKTPSLKRLLMHVRKSTDTPKRGIAQPLTRWYYVVLYRLSNGTNECGGGRLATHKHYASAVRLNRRGGLLTAEFNGPVSNAAFEALRPRIVDAAAGAGCILIDVSKSLTLFTEGLSDQSKCPMGLTPLAYIARLDQQPFWSARVLALREHGFKRVVFLPSERGYLRDWVDSMLALSASKTHRCTLESRDHAAWRL